MLYEYAVDPASLKEWRIFLYLIEQFGVSHGRLISQFPKTWTRLVHETCKDFSYRQRQIMADKLAAIKKHALIRSGRPYDGNKIWKENALCQHQEKPFQAIIAERNDNDPDFVLSAPEITSETPLWNVPRENSISRTADALGAAIAPLLQMSNRILFVDKFFDPVKSKWQKTLCRYIELAMDGRDNIPIFEYHLSFNIDVDFKQDCDEHLANEIPTGVNLKLFIWDQKTYGEGMHARYVLTEKGGIRIDWGLDTGKKGEKTDISLLETDLWKKHWENYLDGAETFKLIDTVSIVGKG